MSIEQTMSLYSSPRISSPVHEIVALSSGPLDELFAADRAVGAAAADPDHCVDIDAYRRDFGWIRWLLRWPALRGAGSLLSTADSEAANRALQSLPNDSPVRRVVRAIRSLLLHGDELRRFSSDVVRAVAERTYDSGIVLVQDQAVLKETWDAIDALRAGYGLTPLRRALTNSKRVIDEGAIALTLGVPHWQRARYRWAFWPPIAPKVVSIGWGHEVARAIRRNDSELGELGSMWKWQRTVAHVAIEWPVVDLQANAEPDPPLDADDPWDKLAVRPGTKQEIQVRRFRIHGRDEVVTDNPRSDSAVSPFIAVVRSDGTLVVGEGVGDVSPCRLVLIFALSATSDEDRRRIHEIRELRNFKIRLSGLQQREREGVIHRIASATRRDPDSVRWLFKRWCGSTPDCPYLPESDIALRMLFAAAGLTEAEGRRIERRVSMAIGDAIRDGLREAREWKQACEAARLPVEVAANLELGQTVTLDVQIPGRWTGQVELVPLGEEIEDPWLG
jgi:hypothetical protein